MSNTHSNIPGFQPRRDGAESQVWWSGRAGQTMIATRRITFDPAAEDEGNSTASTLRGGNLIALHDASGNAYLYDPDANDGRQIALGVLEQSQDLLVDGQASPRLAQMLVHGLLKESALHGLDPRAKQQLSSRFTFDRGSEAAAGVLMHPRGIYRVAENYQVKAEDTGLLFLATAAVTFTLPTIQNGLAFRFAQTANENMVINCGATIIYRGATVATTLTFDTTNQKIGSHVLIEGVYTAPGVLKWLVSNLGFTSITTS